MSFWTTIANFFKKAVKALWSFAAPGLRQAASDFVNNPQLQQAAREAVYAAARQGLTGDKAWVSARDNLTAQLKDTGIKVAANWIDTLLQNAYFAFANSK